MTTVRVAATQMACSWDSEDNLQQAETLVREAAARGAQIILLQELFATPYFCQDEDERFFELATAKKDHPMLARFARLASELEIVLPISFFERDDTQYFNALVVIDADGSEVAHYRKTHIPDAPGYYETYYFSPGDTGYCVCDTRYARIGVGICWDQWFPEAARAMVLDGAQLLFYPTAIGSEPSYPEIDSRDHWQRVMQGNAGANIVPLVASNRIGREQGQATEMDFYGSSFIADGLGAKVAEADRNSQAVITAEFDLEAVRKYRQDWGIFRTRRPDTYGILCREKNEQG
jgi:N-carbamoylputrescine amidase